MFFSSYILFLFIFHSKLSVHVAPPGFSSLTLQLPLAPFPRHHPTACSGPLTTPPPSACFTIPAVGKHAGAWLADKLSCWISGKVRVLPTVESKTSFSQRKKVTIKPPSHMLSQHPNWKEGNEMVSSSLSPPIINQYLPLLLLLILFSFDWKLLNLQYVEKTRAKTCLKCANDTSTAISGHVFRSISVQLIVSMPYLMHHEASQYSCQIGKNGTPRTCLHGKVV